MADCQGCKKLRGDNLKLAWLACLGFDYYTPGEIVFCPHQIAWLLKSLGVLHEYRWVTDAEVKIPRRKKPSGGGYFETPADFAYEVERRMEHCRLDGLMALLYHAWDFEAREIAKYYRGTESEVLHRIEAVVWKVSGWNFHPEYPYRRWLAYREFEFWQSQRLGGV